MFTTPGKSSNDEESSKTPGWFLSRLFSTQKPDEEKKEKEIDPSSNVQARKSLSPHQPMERLDLQMPHETHIAPPNDGEPWYKPVPSEMYGTQRIEPCAMLKNGVSPWKPRAMNDRIVRQNRLEKCVNEPLADTKSKQPQRWITMRESAEDGTNSSQQIVNQKHSLTLAKEPRISAARKYSVRRAPSVHPATRRSLLYAVPPGPHQRLSVGPSTSSTRQESEYAFLLNVYANTSAKHPPHSRQQHFRKNSLPLTTYSRIVKLPGENKRPAELDATHSDAERSSKKARVTFENSEADLYRQQALDCFAKGQDFVAKGQDLLAKAYAMNAGNFTHREHINRETRQASIHMLHTESLDFSTSKATENVVEDEYNRIGESFNVVTGVFNQTDGFILDPAIVKAEEEALEGIKVSAMAKEELQKMKFSTDNDEAQTGMEIRKSEIDPDGWGGTAIGTYLAKKDTWNCGECCSPNPVDVNKCKACEAPRRSNTSVAKSDSKPFNPPTTSGAFPTSSFGGNVKLGFSWGVDTSSASTVGASETMLSVQKDTSRSAPATGSLNAVAPPSSGIVSFSFGIPTETRADAPVPASFSFSVPPKENVKKDVSPVSGEIKSFLFSKPVTSEKNRVDGNERVLATKSATDHQSGELQNGDSLSSKVPFSFGGSVSQHDEKVVDETRQFEFGSSSDSYGKTTPTVETPVHTGTNQSSVPSEATFHFGSHSNKDTNQSAPIAPQPPFQFGQASSMPGNVIEPTRENHFPPVNKANTSSQTNRKMRDFNGESGKDNSNGILDTSAFSHSDATIVVAPSTNTEKTLPFQFGARSSGGLESDSSKAPMTTSITEASSNSQINALSAKSFTFGNSSIPSTATASPFGANFGSGTPGSIAISTAGNAPTFGSPALAVNAETSSKTPVPSFGSNSTVTGITPQFGATAPAANVESSSNFTGFSFGSSTIQNAPVSLAVSEPFQFGAGLHAQVSTNFQFGQSGGTSMSFGGFGTTNKSENLTFGNAPALVPPTAFGSSATSTMGSSFPPTFGTSKLSEAGAVPFGMPPASSGFSAASSGFNAGGPTFGATTSGGSFGSSGFAAPPSSATSQLDGSGGFQMGTSAQPKRRIVRARRPR